MEHLYESIIGAVGAGVRRVLNESYVSPETKKLIDGSMCEYTDWFLHQYGRACKYLDKSGRSGIYFDLLEPGADYEVLELPADFEVPEYDSENLKSRSISKWPVTAELQKEVCEVLTRRWGMYIRPALMSGVLFIQMVAKRAAWYMKNRPIDLAQFYGIWHAYVSNRLEDKAKHDDPTFTFLNGNKPYVPTPLDKAREYVKTLKSVGYQGLSEMLPLVWLPEKLIILTPEGLSKCGFRQRDKLAKFAWDNRDYWEISKPVEANNEIIKALTVYPKWIKQMEAYLQTYHPNNGDVQKYLEKLTRQVEQAKRKFPKIFDSVKNKKLYLLQQLERLRTKGYKDETDKRYLAYLERYCKDVKSAGDN